MATNRPTLNTIAGEKQHIAKNSLTGKPKGSKARSRNDMFTDKLENSVSLSSKRKIESILSDVNNLGDVEKMLLYLRLPTGFSESDVSNVIKSSPSGPNSNREEHTKAYNWICSHLEESQDTSMPKQDVHEEYKTYCDNFTLSPVCPADFGKIMKVVFPNMKRRRLGTRGKSRYCYSGIRKKAEMKSPLLPHLDLSSAALKPCHHCPDHQLLTAAAEVLCSWEKKSHCREFNDISHCAQFLIQEGHIPKESDPAKSFISAMEECGKSPKLSRLDPNQDAWGQRSPEERRRETHHQLQMKLQQKQIVKTMRSKEEGERKKHFGVQVSDTSIENSYGNCEMSQSKEIADLDGEVSPATGGGNLMSPAPGALSTSNSKESPKRKLTPIQPKTLRNVHLFPIPFQPTENQPLKLIYMPKSGKQYAVPANLNIPGSQPLPGSPQAIISAQACQNAVTIRNKVIVTASQVIQTNTTKSVSTLQNSNRDQQRTTINLQGATKANPATTQQVLAMNNQWQQHSAASQGITLTLSDTPSIPMLQTSQHGIHGGILSTETSNQNALLTNQTLQGMQNNQKHTVLLSGNTQSGIFSVQPSRVTGDVSASPESILGAGKAMNNKMVVVPTTNQLSSNIPASAVELVIAHNNSRPCESQQNYIVPNTVQASILNGQNQQTIPTSIASMANLEALFSQAGKIPNNIESNIAVSSSIQSHNQFQKMLNRGNSAPSSLALPVNTSQAPHNTDKVKVTVGQSASNLLRMITEKVKHTDSSKKDAQHQHTGKESKSRLLEELLRDGKPTPPAKVVKPNTSRRNSQTRPKSVAAGMIESKGRVNIPLNGPPVTENASIQGVTDQSVLPSLSINKQKHIKMQTVSGMSAAMMLPPGFRTKTEPSDRQGESTLLQQQQGTNQMRLAFNSAAITLISQDGVMKSNIVMALPSSSQPNLLSMLSNAAIAASPSQMVVGSPATNAGQLSSAPSTPLGNLCSPEAVNSRSSNSTPMSDIGSLPASPAQTQQAQLFFVPIKQGQGLDPALISVNTKSPKKIPGIMHTQSGLVIRNAEAETTKENVATTIQQQLQNHVNNQLNVTRKRHHSGGGLLMIPKTDASFWQALQQQQQSNIISIGNISQLTTKTDMPPPLSLPQTFSSYPYPRGGKPIIAGRTPNRQKLLLRKRNISGPSRPAAQPQTDHPQADLNIPTVANLQSSEEAEMLRILAIKRSQSVPLPEMSESLQNFIISTNKGGRPTATYPEEIEKSLKQETIPRGLHFNLDSQFGAKRNLTTELEVMGSEQDQREQQSNDAYFNEILNVMTDENENARSTHLVGSTGSGNCASSQTEIVPNPDMDSPWNRLLQVEQTLSQHVTSLDDNNSNSSLELQAYGLDNFPHTSNLDLMTNLPVPM